MTRKSGSEKLWGGRFSSELADLALEFSESTAADAPLIAADIWGSEAHSIMLAVRGIISEDDLRTILSGLEHTRQQYESGKFELQPQSLLFHLRLEK